MNRHERRARAKFEPGPEYERTCELLDGLLVQVLHVMGAPRFVLPPREVGLIADLGDTGHRFARNHAAHALVDEVAKIPIDRDRPTILMLAAVLDLRGIEIERASLAELGLTTGGANN